MKITRNKENLFKVAIIVISLIIGFTVVVSAVAGDNTCNGVYYGGNWVVNSSVICESTTVNVNGTLVIQDDRTETSVTQFNSANNSAYDLRANETTLTAGIPDRNGSTPSQYTGDWDPASENVFYIAMNESNHTIQMFYNNTSLSTFVYGIDLDNSTLSGGALGSSNGFDLSFGTSGSVLIIGCFNESNTVPGGVTLLTGATGSATCGNVTGWDSNFTGNFTVYWSRGGSNSKFEVLVTTSGPWKDKRIIATNLGALSLFTTFKNSSVVTAVGNLNLTNVTLNFNGGYLNVSNNAILNVENSTIQFGLNSNGSANMTWLSGSNVSINNSVLTGNATELYWGWLVQTGSYNVTYSNISWNGLPVSNAYANGFQSATGGLIHHNNFTHHSTQGLIVTSSLANSGLNFSSNYVYSTSNKGMAITGGTNAVFSNNLFSSLGSTPDFVLYKGTTSVNITNNTFRGYKLNLYDSGPTGVTLINNNFSGTPNLFISDTNASAANTLIYNNSFGRILWSNMTNLTINTSLNIGDKIIIENNTIGLDNSSLVNLNTTAEITFYALGYTLQPFLLKNGVRCDNNQALCNISSFSSGILVANVSSFSNFSTQEVDAPVVTFSNPANNTNLSSGNQLFNVSISDVSPMDNVIFTFSNGTSAFNVSTSNTSLSLWNVTVNMSTVVEGISNVSVFANDTFGNFNYTSNITIRVDRTAPSVSLVNASFNTTDTTPTVTFNFSDALFSTASCIIYFNSTAYGTSTVNNATSTDATVNATLTQGVYNFTVTCKDGSNNTGVAASTIRIDTSNPTINSLTIGSITSTGASLTVNATDTVTSVGCNYSGAGNDVLAAGSLYSASLSSLTASTLYTVNVTCVDGLNHYASNTTSFTTLANIRAGGDAANVLPIVTSTINNVTRGVTSAVQEQVWSVVSAGEATAFEVVDKSIGVTKIIFTVSETVQNVSVSIVRLGAVPLFAPDFEGKIYRILEIMQTNLTSGEAVISFKVERSWLEENSLGESEVALYRLVDNVWVVLETIVENTDENFVYFEAASPGFSYFVIGAVDGQGEATTEQTAIEPVSDAGERGVGLLAGFSIPGISLDLLPVALLVLLIILVIVIFWVYNRIFGMKKK